MEHSNDNNPEQRIIVPIDENDTENCRILWLSVIVQNLNDSLYKSDKYPFKKRRVEALEWFAAPGGEGSDFAMVCNLANVDFQETKTRIDDFIAGRQNSIDFRCLRRGEHGSTTSARREYMARKRRTEERRSKDFIITPEFFKKTNTKKPSNKNSWIDKLSCPAA
jgi:hypothetical protein